MQPFFDKKLANKYITKQRYNAEQALKILIHNNHIVDFGT